MGDNSVLNGSGDDRPIQVIASALVRPVEFWGWVRTQCREERAQATASATQQAFRYAVWRWDETFALAAACLAATEDVPEVRDSNHPPVPCPLWVALDKHTEAGKKALREVAGARNLSYWRMAFLNFYFESAISNDMTRSHRWRREMEWRLGPDLAEARAGWNQLRPVFQQTIEGEARIYYETWSHDLAC